MYHKSMFKQNKFNLKKQKYVYSLLHTLHMPLCKNNYILISCLYLIIVS